MRRRSRGSRKEPVAIWRLVDTGELVCVAGYDKARVAPTEVWTYCAANRVDGKDAKFAWANGFWPDEPPPTQISNLPSDPFERLKIEIEAQQTRAEEWLGKRPTIMTQVDCNLAVNMERELLRLNKQADALHKDEKAPILEATRACDDKFRFRTVVASVAEKLRKAYGRFMADEEARQKAAAAAKFQEEHVRVAAERKRLEEERAAKLQNDPVAALTEAPPEMPELPLGPEPVKIQAGGGIGRRAGLRSVWIGTVTDYREAMLHFVEHPQMRELVDKLVAHQVKDMKAAAKIPGVTVKERRAA